MPKEIQPELTDFQPVSRTRTMRTDRDVTLEAQELVRQAAQPGTETGERICAAIRRASHRLGLSYGKTKAYWYAERRRVSHAEFANLKARLETLNERAEYRKAVLDDADKALSRARRVVGEAGALDGQDHGLFGANLSQTVG